MLKDKIILLSFLITYMYILCNNVLYKLIEFVMSRELNLIPSKIKCLFRHKVRDKEFFILLSI